MQQIGLEKQQDSQILQVIYHFAGFQEKHGNSRILTSCSLENALLSYKLSLKGQLSLLIKLICLWKILSLNTKIFLQERFPTK